MLAGLETPSKGRIVLGGKGVADPSFSVPPEKRGIGMVFQDYALFPHQTVADNVGYGIRNWDSNDRNDRVHELLVLVGLKDFGDRYPDQLSGGEQQRVALARALATRPLALFLDEPFSNLDTQLRERMRGEVKDILRSNDVTAIFVTHDQGEALFMGDQVGVMTEGKLEQIDTPETVFHQPRSPFVARFLETADFLPASIEGRVLETEIGFVDIPDELPVGATPEVMVRPDCVTITPDLSGQGYITARLFEGMHYLYTVALDSGVVHSLVAHTAVYDTGDRVRVSIEPEHILTCFWDSRRKSCDAKALPPTSESGAEPQGDPIRS